MAPTLPFRHSLKFRVTFATLAVFLAGLWLLSYSASVMLRQDMQRLVGEQQLSNISAIASDINQDLQDRIKALEAVAQSVAQTMQQNSAAVQELIEQRPILPTMFNAGVYVTNVAGTAIASIPTSAGRVGLNYMEQAHVASALKEGTSNIGKPHIGKALKAPVFGIATPIRDVHGKAIGALIGVTNLGLPNFLDTITDRSYGKTGGYVLVSPQHRLVITATNKKQVIQSLREPEVTPVIDYFFKSCDSYAVYRDVSGVEELASCKRIPVADWYFGATQFTEEAFAPIHEMQQRMLLTTIFLTLMAGGLIWWMLERQLSPMVATAATLASMSDTDKPLQPLPITRQDEIGALIGGFNRLLNVLAHREDTLKENKERFQLIMETIDEVFWMADVPIERMLYISPGYERVWGRTRRSLYENPRSFIEAIHPEDAERVIAALAVERTRQPFNHEYRVIRPDGTIRWVWDRGFPVRNQMGTVTHFTGVAQDVTERKLAEAERNIASVAFESQDGMVIADADCVILRVNKSFTDITGYSAEEAVGHKTNLLKSGYHDEQFYQSMWEILNRLDYWAGEIWNRRKDGAVYPEWLTITAVKAEDGKITNYVATMTDLAERKQTEHELMTLRTEMQQLMEWQVASQTVAALSHEVNQPLASIAILCEAAGRILATDGTAVGSIANKPERLKQILQSLAAESERAGIKVRSLLESLHRPDTEREPIALSTLLRETIRVSRANGLTDYEVTVDCATDMPLVLVNRLQIEKVLLNLIGNGVEAMRQANIRRGKIRINVNMNDEGTEACVRIKDEGPGVSRAIGQQIFHPFFTTKPNGMGMGLAISRALIQAQGGKLWDEADDGPGATFCFTLPFAR